MSQIQGWQNFGQTQIGLLLLISLTVFLLNIFIDHHTVNSHLLMHGYNTDTVNELNSGQKRLDIFTFTVTKFYT